MSVYQPFRCAFCPHNGRPVEIRGQEYSIEHHNRHTLGVVAVWGSLLLTLTVKSIITKQSGIIMEFKPPIPFSFASCPRLSLPIP